MHVKQDTAGKYRELAAKKCHHVPKPTVELQRSCTLAECPVRTTPNVHRWSTYHQAYPHPQPQPPPQPPSPAEWHSSPWSQVCFAQENLYARLEGQRTVALLTGRIVSLQCTVTCGGGVQARTVQCLVSGKPSAGCALHLKPSMSQACNTNFCPQPEKKGNWRWYHSAGLMHVQKRIQKYYHS